WRTSRTTSTASPCTRRCRAGSSRSAAPPAGMTCRKPAETMWTGSASSSARPSTWSAPAPDGTSSSPEAASCSTDARPRRNQSAACCVLKHVVHVVNAEAGRSLHERAVAGDEDAFEALVGPLVEPAIRLAYSMLGDRTEAEDAVQEAVTRAWRKLGQLRAGMPVRPWFLAIVVNQCRNIRRTRWFRFVRTSDTFSFDGDVEPGVERIDLARALARLSDSDRQALFLHFY